MNILIIDNNAEFALSLKDIVGLDGHAAVVTGDSRSALRLAASGEFDLILTDMVMPGESGISILQSLEEIGSPAPVVVISALSDEKVKKRALELGAAGYLEKPINIPALRSLLKSLQTRN